MSLLFTPVKIGTLELPNRLVHSATYESMSEKTGEVSDRLVGRYRKLGRGEIGLIIPGYFCTHPLGRTTHYQPSLASDDMIPGVKRMVEAVHEGGGRIVLQIAHAGRQTKKKYIGRRPLAPSSRGRDPAYLVKPKQMNENDIREAIRSFAGAARRAEESGADGVQIHAAHGYLINQFLSPYFNVRNDSWGGSEANRFRFFREVFLEVKQAVSGNFPVLVKLNTQDFTPKPGITPDLAAKYAGLMAELGIDGLEVSCGSPIYSFMNMCRGEVPVKDMAKGFSPVLKPFVRMYLKRMKGRYDLREGYNLEAARLIKPTIGDIPLVLVGGLRRVPHMEAILEERSADCISMSRPFIREPSLVKRILEGKTDSAGCVSCNKCFAGIVHNRPVKCYYSSSSHG